MKEKIPRNVLTRDLDSLGIFAVQKEEASRQIGGSILPNSGLAFIRYEDVFYMINPSVLDADVVHELSDGELSTLHMRNHHLDRSRRPLSIKEIGEYPFDSLVTRLRMEKSLSLCLRFVDEVLDPLEEQDTEIRRHAIKIIEDFLQKYPDNVQAIIDKVGAFIPPEGYELDDLDKVISATDDDSSKTFAESFPLLFKMLTETQSIWERNVVEHADQRLTREQIQNHHDDITEISSRNILQRPKESLKKFTDAIKGLENGRKSADVIVIHQLVSAKENVLDLSESLPGMRERYEEIEPRRPGVLGRFEEALSTVAQAEKSLAELEKILSKPIVVSNVVG